MNCRVCRLDFSEYHDGLCSGCFVGEYDRLKLQNETLTKRSASYSEILDKQNEDMAQLKRLNSELKAQFIEIVGIMQGCGVDKEVFEQVYGLAVNALGFKRVVSSHKDSFVWDFKPASGLKNETQMKCEGCQQIKPDVLPYCHECYMTC